MKRSNHDNREERGRAVSTVIGVIILVAVTVIVAAVIGAFVLDNGDQQETAQSFESEQRTQYLERNDRSGKSCQNPDIYSGPDKRNETFVTITPVEGEAMSYSNVITKHAGRAVWQYADSKPYADPSIDKILLGPAPNRLETLGSNEAKKWSTGQSVEIFLALGDSKFSYENYPEWEQENWDPLNNYGIGWLDCPNQGYTSVGTAGAEGGEPAIYQDGYLETGDELNVMWKASSGNQTQTLYNYTVQ